MRVREIKKLSPELLEELVFLDREAFGPGGADEWTLPMLVRCGKVFILEDNGHLVGLAYLVRNWQRPTHCFLHGFSIARDYQGQGWGQFFMKQILARLRKQKIEKIRLTVSPQNEMGQKLYRRFGFHEVEYSQNEYGRGEDRLILELKLAEEEDGGEF